MPLISAQHLYKVFGRRPQRGVEALERGATREELRAEGLTPAVIDASFDVAPGEIFVVMGLSGSGKSTLIRMINGLHPATAGDVVIDGANLARLKGEALRRVRREKISMVFQHFALLPHRTVGENAAYGLKVQGINRADREARATRALSMVGLSGWGGSMPGELSGGMQQRVGLARALASETDIMLMDEAFSALDPLIRREMQDQLVELQQRLDKTILFITHDLNEAMRLGDRIAMMRDGRIEQIGTAEQILNDPKNNYVAKFVHDVDRAKVLTAGSVMEPPAVVIGAEQGPQQAHKLIREHQLNALPVVNRDRTPVGVVLPGEIARAVREGSAVLPLTERSATTVTLQTPLADLLADAARRESPLLVVDEQGRLAGLIPRVTLLAALSHEPNGVDAPPSGEARDPHAPTTGEEVPA
ncbi:quaternary amine ABC transporter ATP-binding protein [Ornithinimicrobium avium]|uniref:Glycine betaine/L-proline ABC transporter ATP-binding protein n=1 Tax=Ornithinimicrobium avium TaxID=2283195 RepID=A0A345NMD4_9MICO|nr:glycine betaine/L-proline ABC transporter ATP-binding protein [Ornithinimicrobium avium]AXH96192.1 glycine betaine/L-proline ABC transporter ATP-binding protein [Ornithinimicrobium avium]